METGRLKYFCTIAETGSLTKAAELLGVSHSGLSKALATLQTETKLQLMQPKGRGLELTEQGKWFYKKAIEILKIENEIMLGSQKQTQTLRIALSEVLAVSCAAKITDEYSAQITILEADVGEIENKILNNEIDFGFTFSPSPQLDLEYLELGSVEFNAYAHQNYLKNKTAKEINYVVPAHPSEFNPLGYKARDGWPQNLPRNIQFQVSGFAIALDLVRSAQCAVYMPDFISEFENILIKVPAHMVAFGQRNLFLVKKKNIPESKEMKKISKVLRKVCCS